MNEFNTNLYINLNKFIIDSYQIRDGTGMFFSKEVLGLASNEINRYLLDLKNLQNTFSTDTAGNNVKKC